jgi:hypothetical protein
VYSGKHLGDRVATARYTGAVGSGEQFNPHSHADANTCSHANAHSYSYADTDAHSHAETEPNSHAHANTFRRKLRCSVEFGHCLSWRQYRECRQQQLHGSVLESGVEPDHAGQQRPRRYRRSVVLTCSMQRWQPHAHTYA